MLYPAAKTMLNILSGNETDTDVDLLLILDSWNAEHCQGLHTAPQNRVCTHAPVARFTRKCDLSVNRPICQASVDYVHDTVAHPNFTCAECGAIAAECWVLLPL